MKEKTPPALPKLKLFYVTVTSGQGPSLFEESEVYGGTSPSNAMSYARRILKTHKLTDVKVAGAKQILLLQPYEKQLLAKLLRAHTVGKDRDGNCKAGCLVASELLVQLGYKG